MKFSILKVVRFAVIFAATPAALATTWYVNGVSGRDSNNCKSPTTACKTIKHVISLASSGDTITVAPATYKENLAIGISLKILGASARTTIIDGGGVNTVVTIPTTNPNVTLSNLTIRNGVRGGIYNNGTLLVSSSTIVGNRSVAGGGISDSGSLTIKNSTISGNVAVSEYPGSGGGIAIAAHLCSATVPLAGMSQPAAASWALVEVSLTPEL